MDIKRIVAATLASLCVVSSLAACSADKNGGEESDVLKPPVIESTEDKEEESKDDTGFDVSAITDFAPYVTLGQYKKLTVYNEQVTDELVQKSIKELLKTVAEYKEMPADTAAAIEDKVTIDYVGYRLETMEAFEGGSAKGSELELGSGKFIPGFEEQVVGHKVGDVFDIMVTFPEEYHNAELAGVEVKFNITLHKVSRPQYPELNDETAKKLKYDSADAMKKAVVNALEVDAEKNNMSRTWKAVMDKATVKKYPEGSIEKLSKEYSEFYEEQYNYYASKGGMELDAYLQMYYGMTEQEFKADLAAKSKEYAETTMKQKMVMYFIADAEFKREITEDERKENIIRYAEKEGITVEELLQKYDDKVINESIIWDKVMLLVFDSSIKTDVEPAVK